LQKGERRGKEGIEKRKSCTRFPIHTRQKEGKKRKKEPSPDRNLLKKRREGRGGFILTLREEVGKGKKGVQRPPNAECKGKGRKKKK